MPNELGIGTRVAVLWFPECPPQMAGQHGIITDGPVPPNSEYVGQMRPDDIPCNLRAINGTGENVWGVELDNGIKAAIIESGLKPLDDDDNFTTETDNERTLCD